MARENFKQGLTKNVVLLGIVSGLTDISSEMLYPLVPLFLSSVLNAPMSVIGVIEGAAEAVASILKAVSGLWSDKLTKRKPFVVWGYGLSSLAKPLMALAYTWHFVLLARVTDRVGKGIRTSPRDALVAASTPKEHWGKAFGFHRAMDTAGAALGPLAALALMHFAGLDYRPIFAIAFVPAFIGVLVLFFYVREAAPQPSAAAQRPETGGTVAERIKSLSPDYKRFLLFYCVFALGNSSDAFLLLKAKSMGFDATHVILAYVGYNIVYALSAAPAGWLSDKLGRIRTMTAGFVIFAAVYAGFALVKAPGAIWLLFAAYGFYGAFNEGIAKAAISDLSGGENRATAMGMFNAVSGLMAFAASAIAGLLWSKISPAAPFAMGAACALAAALLMTSFKRTRTAS